MLAWTNDIQRYGGTGMTTTTETTLQQLVDRNDITDLVHRLGAALDDGHFDELRSLLVDEVTVRTPGGMAGGATRSSPKPVAITDLIGRSST